MTREARKVYLLNEVAPGGRWSNQQNELRWNGDSC